MRITPIDYNSVYMPPTVNRQRTVNIENDNETEVNNNVDYYIEISDNQNVNVYHIYGPQGDKISS